MAVAARRGATAAVRPLGRLRRRGNGPIRTLARDGAERTRLRRRQDGGPPRRRGGRRGRSSGRGRPPGFPGASCSPSPGRAWWRCSPTLTPAASSPSRKAARNGATACCSPICCSSPSCSSPRSWRCAIGLGARQGAVELARRRFGRAPALLLLAVLAASCFGALVSELSRARRRRPGGRRAGRRDHGARLLRSDGDGGDRLLSLGRARGAVLRPVRDRLPGDGVARRAGRSADRRRGVARAAARPRILYAARRQSRHQRHSLGAALPAGGDRP